MDKPEPLSDDEILDLLEDAGLLTTARFKIINGLVRSRPTGVIRAVVDRTQRIVAARYEARIAERDELVQKVHQLERERDALRADADRYRYLRDSGDTSIYAMRFDIEGDTPVGGPDLDASIDAARAAQEKPPC